MRSLLKVLGAAAISLSPILSLLASPAPAAAAGATEKVYVGQRSLHNVAVIDATTLLPTSTSPIALGATAVPQELVADPKRPFLYVADSGSNAIHVINTSTDVLETSIPTSAGPQGLALASDGYHLYVATTTKVEKIDTRSRSIAKSVSLAPFTPWDVALSHDGQRLWVTAGGTSGEVRSLNPSTLAQIDTMTPAGALSSYGVIGSNLEPSPNSARVADMAAHTMWFFDDVNNTSGGAANPGYVAGPWAIEREPLGGMDRILVTDGAGSTAFGGDSVFEFDGASALAPTRSLGNLGGTPSVADSPTEIAFSQNNARAFVTLRATDKISVITYDLAGTLTETNVVSLTAGADPYGIEVARSSFLPKVFAGSDRYKTAVLTSMEQFADGSGDQIVIARGDAFPDGLAAGPLGSMLDASLLLTKPTDLPDATKVEIERLFDNVDDVETDVYVIGGTAAINESVVSEIQAINSKLDIKRLDGADRIATAIKVADELGTLRGAKPTTAFIAKSSDYPDALTASGFAGNMVLHPTVAPVLLNPSDALDARVKAFLESSKPTLAQVFLMGGTAALSSEVASDVSDIVTTTRLGGANRYATGVTAAKNFFPTGPAAIAFASGQNFPDALVLGPFVGRYDASGLMPTYSMPILPVKQDSVPTEISGYMASVSTIVRSFVGGGSAAVGDSVVSTLGGLY